jgi:hypothetical protein
MWHAHALGLSGRSRGVHHIRQMLGAAAAVEIGVIFGGDRRPITIQSDHIGEMPRQRRGAALLGQQHCRSGVGDHKAQPLLGIVGIQRQVRAAGLEDRQQPDQQLGRALDCNTDQRIRADAKLT